MIGALHLLLLSFTQVLRRDVLTLQDHVVEARAESLEISIRAQRKQNPNASPSAEALQAALEGISQLREYIKVRIQKRGCAGPGVAPFHYQVVLLVTIHLLLTIISGVFPRHNHFIEKFLVLLSPLNRGHQQSPAD